MATMLGQLVFPLDTDTQSVYAYLQLLGVSVTKTGLDALLREHPDAGTLLSVSDVLTGLGVENVVAKVSEEQLGQLETPFIARMKSGEGLALAVVKRLDNDALVYLPPSTGSTVGAQRWVSTSKQAFGADMYSVEDLKYFLRTYNNRPERRKPKKNENRQKRAAATFRKQLRQGMAPLKQAEI